MTVTEALDLAEAAANVASALIDLAHGRATTADAETIADIALTDALSFVPGAEVFAALAPPLANIIIEGLASGAIEPGASGEGWTRETPHNGRRA